MTQTHQTPRASDRSNGRSASSADAALAQQELRIECVVQNDGSFAETICCAMRPLDSVTAGQVRALPIRFTAGYEDVEILSACTVKRDGRRLDVDCQAINQHMAPETPLFPMFNVLRQKTVTFPDLEPGDDARLQYRKRRTKPLIDGQFAFYREFLPSFPWADVDVAIRVPLTMALQVSTIEAIPTIQEEKHSRVYRWSYRSAADRSEAAPAPLVRLPSVGASSFPGYEELTASLRFLFDQREQAAGSIEAVVRGAVAAAAPTDRVGMLYRWMIENIRFVPLRLGHRVPKPHSPDLIVDNGYGDSLDHAALFRTLLGAVGIDSEIVLTAIQTPQAIDELASLRQFDHVVVWVGELQSYFDTTQAMQAEGCFSASMIGRLVLHIGAGGAQAVGPVIREGNSVLTLATEAELTGDGTIRGTTSTVAIGAASALLRDARGMLYSSDVNKAFAAQLGHFGHQGFAEFVVDGAEESAEFCRTGARFELQPRPRLFDGAAFKIPAGVGPLGRAIDTLVRLWLFELNGKGLAFSLAGTCAREQIDLKLPPGFRISRIPTPVSIDADSLSYRSTWSADTAQTLRVQRELLIVARGRGDLHAVTEFQRCLRQEYEIDIAVEPEDGLTCAMAG